MIKNSTILDQSDLDTVLKYMLYGGLAGGSAAAITGAIRLLNNNAFKKLKPTDKDDDVMYVVKKSAEDAKPEAQRDTVIGSGLAAVAAPMAAAGTFAFGNWLINKYLEEKAQRELDAAQRMFVNSQGYEVLKKKAGLEVITNLYTPQPNRGHIDLVNTVGEGTQSMANVAAAIYGLLSLGAGVTTYQYLKSKYPIKRPEAPKHPKRIEYVDSEDAIKGYVPTEKEAAYNEDNCMEMAARCLCDMSKESSVASGIVHAVAAGRLNEFEKAVEDVGFVAATDITKGASAVAVDRDARELATVYCTKFASFSPQFRLTVAADFASLHPLLVKEAAELPDGVAHFAAGQAAALESGIRAVYAVENGLGGEFGKAASANTPGLTDVKAAMERTIEKLAAAFVDSENGAEGVSEMHEPDVDAIDVLLGRASIRKVPTEGGGAVKVSV